MRNSQTPETICLVSPYRRWIDLYCQILAGNRSVTHQHIETEKQLQEHIQSTQHNSLFSDNPFYHLSFNKPALLSQSIKLNTAAIFLSINQMSYAQIKSLSKLQITIKDMQYPSRSDLQTVIHHFAKQRKTSCSFNHLLQEHSSNIDDILEACERQYLLSLDLQNNEKTAIYHSSPNGFRIAEFIYREDPSAIKRILDRLDPQQMTSAYWLIVKQLGVFSQSPELTSAELMQISPLRSLHTIIKTWYSRHRKKITQYRQMCIQIEEKMKGSKGPDLEQLIMFLFLSMGRSNG